jgi:hypothetical protein
VPPHPSRRLNAWLVPTDPERVCPESLGAALGQITPDQAHEQPRRSGRELIVGGFLALRLDHRPQGHLYGNKQGGYRVRCPACRTPLAREAAFALRRWQGGQTRHLDCPECRASLDLAGLSYRPLAAPARFAIELRDVSGLALTSVGATLFRRVMAGDFVVVGSRG